MVKQVNKRVTVKGVKQWDENGKGWGIKQALYADNEILMEGRREELRHNVDESGGRVME